VWEGRAAVWTDPRALVGASDAGAHLDMLDTFTYSTTLLGRGAREHGVISFEEAVRQLTTVPADLYGMPERGRIAEGAHADLVLFDPTRVGPGPVHTRHDLPAGASRLYAEAEGIERVFVAGEAVVANGAFLDARPGAVLRSGRDTRTVRANGGSA
jgi:N-acyl-D-aspartate/D-glutamate deacylase